MRYEVEPIAYVLRVYDDRANPDDYVASAHLRVYGDRGWISSISSPRLFEAIAEHFNQFMDKMGLVTLEGYMSPSMARALRMKCKNWADYNIHHNGECAGRMMPWVVLSKLENVEIDDD